MAAAPKHKGTQGLALSREEEESQNFRETLTRRNRPDKEVCWNSLGVRSRLPWKSGQSSLPSGSPPSQEGHLFQPSGPGLQGQPAGRLHLHRGKSCPLQNSPHYSQASHDTLQISIRCPRPPCKMALPHRWGSGACLVAILGPEVSPGSPQPRKGSELSLIHI